MERRNIKKPTKEKLYKWYHEDNENTSQIAKKLSVTSTSILRWMREYGIKRRKGSYSMLPGLKKPTKEELEDLYINQRKSNKNIGRNLGVSEPTIRKWMDEYGISIRSSSESKLPKGFVKPTKEELKELYRKISVNKIAKNYKISNPTITKWLKDYNISIRRNSNFERIKEIIKPSKEKLEDLYWEQGKSTTNIGRELGVVMLQLESG